MSQSRWRIGIVGVIVAAWFAVLRYEPRRVGSAGSEFISQSSVVSLPFKIPMPRQGREISAVEPINQVSALDLIKEYVESHQTALNLQPHHSYSFEEFKGPLGSRIKMSFQQDQIPIVGMEIHFLVNLSGNVDLINSSYYPADSVVLNDPKMTMQEFWSQRFGSEKIEPSHSFVLYRPEGANQLEPAYLFSTMNGLSSEQWVVRVSDGSVISRISSGRNW